MENIRFCTFCRSVAELVCHRCRDPYCSKNCQQIDWPQHKLVCFPMPTLVKLFSDVKSEPEIEPDFLSSLRPPSPSTKFRNLKLSDDCEAPLKNGFSNGSMLQHNSPPIITSNDFIKTGNAPSVDRGATNDKSETKNHTKAYYKSDKVDVLSIRKPGLSSQVDPKQMKLDAPVPKQVTVEPPKQVTVEPPKQVTVEPPTQVKVDPPKQLTVEPPKQLTVEPPKQLTVEPPKQATVEATPKIESKPSVSVSCLMESDKLNKSEIEPIAVQPEKIETGAWMKPSPIDENTFVEVIVQYLAPDNTTWVTMAKDNEANNNLLRDINKSISKTSTPTPTEIQVNSLFLVPFEEIYYRGIVLQAVSPKGAVLVRLIDFGNEFELPIGELKTPHPAVAEINANAFPIQFKNARVAEIGNSIKIKKETIADNGVMTVIVEGERSMLTLKDIDVIPIPVGEKKDLFCLDFSNVGMGYISASIPDSKLIQFVELLGPKMTEHCTRSKDGAYSPQVNELCLAQFEDEQWYRAVTLGVLDNDKFEIMFIDYGNIITVNSSSIRKMADDFLHPCLTNLCSIEGLSKAPAKDDIRKWALYFNDHQKFQAEKVEKDKDGYVIHVTI